MYTQKQTQYPSPQSILSDCPVTEKSHSLCPHCNLLLFSATIPALVQAMCPLAWTTTPDPHSSLPLGLSHPLPPPWLQSSQL